MSVVFFVFVHPIFGVSFVEIDLRKRWQTNAQHGILECMLAECHGAADSLSLRIWFKS